MNRHNQTVSRDFHACQNVHREDHVVPPADIPVRMLPLEDAVAQCHAFAILHARLSAMLEPSAERPAPYACLGADVPTAHLQTLITLEPTAPRTVVMVMPPEFEGALTQFVGATPDIFNYRTVDCQHAMTMMRYSMILPGESRRTELWAGSDGIDSAIRAATTWHDGELSGSCLPVVVASGSTVAVGGFSVDAVWLSCLSTAAMGANAVFPEELYSHEELAAAARRAEQVGQAPWYGQYWTPDASLLHCGNERVIECPYYCLSEIGG